MYILNALLPKVKNLSHCNVLLESLLVCNMNSVEKVEVACVAGLP